MIQTIVGVATFDLNGLPKEYFITQDNQQTHWVQLVFQALGLKSLLLSSLKLEGFQHITIDLKQQSAIVVRGKDNYIAVLMKSRVTFASSAEADQFSQWVRWFESQVLRQHDRFIVA
ncbi:MAG: hypothetical protein EA342_20860 [Leptolyngbya sp. LCM1.Bin17]|nr:MAG: hypothetical protein EA342_20860 [Leptolyngbya sp. LCM1.Bin17]